MQQSKSAKTTPISDVDLAQQAYNSAPSRPEFERLSAQRIRFEGELTAKAAERENLRKKKDLEQSLAGKVERLLRPSPADEKLFNETETLEARIKRLDEESVVLRFALTRVEGDIAATCSKIEAEIAELLRPRHAEIVQRIIEAGDEFVAALRSERHLRSSVEDIQQHQFTLQLPRFPEMTFRGIFWPEGEFRNYRGWKEMLARLGLSC